jgi:hypothetical protein
MRAVGEIMFQFIKTRSSNAVGKTLFLDWDPQNLLIRDILEGGKSKRNDDGPGKSGTTQATTPNLSSEKANQLKNLLGRFGDS